MSFSLVGQVWDQVGFREYLQPLDLSWAKGITMHHTAVPSLAQRPQGLTVQHIRNIADYYQRQLGWSRGPHLFVDDGQIFGMSPLTERGIHAVSFNATHLGIEVLGNYDSEDPTKGRGKACWETAAMAVVELLRKTGLTAGDINGHRDDPQTAKSCPGKKVDLDVFRAAVAPGLKVDEVRGDQGDRAGELDFAADRVLERIENIQWQLDQMRKELGR